MKRKPGKEAVFSGCFFWKMLKKDNWPTCILLVQPQLRLTPVPVQLYDVPLTITQVHRDANLALSTATVKLVHQAATLNLGMVSTL